MMKKKLRKNRQQHTSFFALTSAFRVFTAAACLIAMSLSGEHRAIAQQVVQGNAKAALSERAVDSLRIENRRLVGIVFRQTKDDLLLAVERQWLKQTYPDYYSQAIQEEKKQQTSITDTYYSRMDTWLADVEKDESYVRLLESEILRFKDDQAKSENSPDGSHYRFMVFALKRDQITKLRVQPLRRKRVAAIAWKHDLQDVSLRSYSDLRKALVQQKVDVTKAYFDLSKQLPPAELTSRQWKIRRAMYDRHEAGGGLEFQGQGEQLFEIGEDIDLSKIALSMAGSARADAITKLGRELGLPEFSPSRAGREQNQWIKQVTQAADQKNQESVLVKRILDSSATDQVTVEISLFCKLGPRQWELVVQLKGSASLSAQPKEKIEQLMQDPRVQQAINLTKQFGLGGQGQLEQAMRQGAATQDALRIATEKVDQILAQNTARLEGPWLLE